MVHVVRVRLPWLLCVKLLRWRKGRPKAVRCGALWFPKNHAHAVDSSHMRSCLATTSPRCPPRRSLTRGGNAGDVHTGAEKGDGLQDG